MSILDKHPAPWRHECGEILNAKREDTDEPWRNVVSKQVWDIDPDALPLILAAPELLAALKACPVRALDGMVASPMHPTKSQYQMLAEWDELVGSLIARIEKDT